MTERSSGDVVVRVNGLTKTLAICGAKRINAAMITKPSANPGKR